MKYLDALCVYFWATTPVLISIMTFSTYVLLGNTLTAAKVYLMTLMQALAFNSISHNIFKYQRGFEYRYPLPFPYKIPDWLIWRMQHI